MPSFREVRNSCKIEGFQCHHLIPVEVVEARPFARFFGIMRETGFDANDFASNGMHLPCMERQAVIFRLPLHRGAHPRYNELVAERISELTQIEPTMARLQLAVLQSSLRQGLRSKNLSGTLCDTEALSGSTDFSKLDAAADLLWHHTER